MGCLCCKTASVKDNAVSGRDRLSSKTPSEVKVQSRRDESGRRKGRCDNNDGGTVLYDKKTNLSARVHSKNHERKREKTDYSAGYHPSIKSMPKAIEGEYVAAGWPPWLASVAGEAIKGWIPRRADSFEKLDKVCFFSVSPLGSFELNTLFVYYFLFVDYHSL